MPSRFGVWSLASKTQHRIFGNPDAAVIIEAASFTP
jgi:hypothetical protein